MTTAASASPTTGRSSVQMATMAVAVVFLLIGILGFIPGITTNYEQMMFAGHESGAMLLGVFQVSILHNIVHLLFGIVGLVCARTASASRMYLIWGGVVYVVLWLYGLFVPEESMANFVPLNDAVDWLHLVLAIAMVALGVLLGRKIGDRRRP